MDSMTLDELRRSAMGPRRLYQKIAKSIRMQEPLQPSSNRLILEHEEETTHARIHIVPGGRYLLASTDYSITLWDLGSPYMEQCSPRILHTLQFKARVSDVSSPVIYKTNLLRFTAQVEMMGSQPFRLQVYEVGPLPENHPFRLIGELEIARHGYNFHVEVVELYNDGRLAFYFWSTVPHERRIVVWDFSKSLLSSLHWYPTGSSWSSRPSRVSHSPCIVR
ncbi:hypothetical protein FA13DRAFT_1323522 [Coprinellus micaceus]|uniref:WD40 repeat-like protein n=1 Tax=Coprinellus micaceus TaxID=71717 RepID=A0A4Y7SSL1_COPMI|nr:hypothetical protein FA13DRAFT_1323522 [Coprinellus micaceus]